MSPTPDTEPARQRAQALVASARALDILGAQSVDDLLRVADWILAQPTASPDIRLDDVDGRNLARLVNDANARRRPNDDA